MYISELSTWKFDMWVDNMVVNEASHKLWWNVCTVVNRYEYK